MGASPVMEGTGLGAWLEEGQGHGGFLKLSRKRTSHETKITLGTLGAHWGGENHGAAKERGAGTKVDLGIATCRGFGVMARSWH